MTVTPAEARAISSAAYVFVYPLVVSYASMYGEAIDPSSRSFSGGDARPVAFGATCARRLIGDGHVSEPSGTIHRVG
jgi:hypothetical protein